MATQVDRLRDVAPTTREARIEIGMLDILGKKDHREFRAQSLNIIANISHRLLRNRSATSQENLKNTDHKYCEILTPIN